MKWTWLSPKDRAVRDAAILEKWKLGWDRRAIAAYYDITPGRVSQIVHSFEEVVGTDQTVL